MAKGIRGITVEIGANTGPLEKSLKDVNKTTRELQGELREVEKGLKFNPNNIELTRQKQQILKEEIAATSEKLKTLKDAQKDVERQFREGKIGEDQYRAFQRELIKTESQLKELKKESKSVSVIGAAFNQVKEKIQEATDKLAPFINGLKKAGEVSGKIGKAGIDTVGKSVDIAQKGLKIYAGTAAAAGTAIAGMTYKAAQGADDINTLAKTTGLSVEQIQKFQYASDIIDVSLETMSSSMARMTRNMGSAQKGSKRQAEAFQQLGVAVTGSNGQLRDAETVFNDTIAALGKIENETQRDAIAMEIFGRSAKELNPLIEGGAEELKRLGDEAEAAGLILSQDALDHLNEFNDSVDILKANAGKAGNVLAGTFSAGLKDVTDVVGSMIPQVTGLAAQLFSGKDVGKNQKKLTQTLIDGAKQIVEKLAEQLPTFLEGFNAIIISVVEAIVAVLPTAINSILPTLINGFVGLIQGLLPQIPILLPIIVQAAIDLFMGLLDGLNTIVPQLMAMLPGIIQQVSDMIIQNLPLIISAGIQLLISLIGGITQSIPILIEAVIALIPVIIEALIENLPLLIQAGIDLIVALAKGLPQAIPAIIAALPQIIMAIINGIISVNWLDVGKQVITGIAKGLWDGIRNIDFKGIGNSLLKGIKGVLGIKSPSTLFRDMVGKNLALGIGEGFGDEMSNVSDEMAKQIPTSFDMPGIGINGSTSAQQRLDVGGVIRIEGVSNDGDFRTMAEYVLEKVNDRLRWEARMA